MNAFYDRIMELPAVDIHSHLRGEHTQAHDLGEVFFYHVAAQAMVAAGMPPELARGEGPSEGRIREALPYLASIRNTTMFWVIRQTLRRLHDFDAEDLSWSNWETLHRRFRETAEQPGWTREVLCEKARLTLSLTGMVRTRDQIAPDQRDIIDYTCEQPVTSSDLLGLLERNREPITSGAELSEAVQGHVERRVAAGAGSFTYWPPRGFVCPAEPPEAIDPILQARARSGELTEQQVVALDGAVSHLSLTELNERSLSFVLCLGIGFGEKRRTILRYDPTDAGAVLTAALRYPNVSFFLMLGNVAQSHEMNTVAKQLPNVYLASSWWHGMYPAQAEHELRERLEMIPHTRLVAIITDAYCAEWSVARSILGRHVLARVLWDKVQAGDYTEAFALEIAQAMLQDNPARVFARE